LAVIITVPVHRMCLAVRRVLGPLSGRVVARMVTVARAMVSLLVAGLVLVVVAAAVLVTGVLSVAAVRRRLCDELPG
jgi:hypothetical protein